MRGEGERASSLGALYLTNIQQFYERQNSGGDEPDEMTAVLGPKPPAQKLAVEDFDKRIAARGGPVAVLNDEAHHTHDEESEWNKIIRALHAEVPGGAGGAIGFHGHAAPQQGAAVFVDRVRLPAQAGDHRQRREAPAEGHRARHHRAALGYREHALSGLSRGWRRTMEGIPRPAWPRSASSRSCS